MKKALFVLATFLLLGSCGKNSDPISLDYQGDASALKDNKEFSASLPFRSTLEEEKKEGKWHYLFSIDEPEKDFHQVRVILMEEKEECYWVFGYDGNYTLTKNKDKEDKESVKGIRMFVSSSMELNAFKFRFSSQEEVLYFQVSVEK